MSIILEALILQRLDQIQTTVNALTQKVKTMSDVVNNLDTQIANLVSAVAAQEGVIASTETLIQGFSAQLAAAIAATIAGGVKPEQLQQISDVVDRVQAETAGLAQAIQNNPLPTPDPTPTPDPNPVPTPDPNPTPAPAPQLGEFKLGSSKLGQTKGPGEV